MKKVLVIDDDLQVSKLISEILKEEGYLTESAKNGIEGLKLFKEQKFDVVIMDIIMPEKEGVETLLEMKQFDSDVKVIMVSGGGRCGPENYLPMTKTFGAKFTFEKPIEVNKLLNAVKVLSA
jgi:DNA-binding response OmpR family regulator